MKKSYTDLVKFITEAKNFTEDNKLTYAIQKVNKRIFAALTPVEKEYQEEIADLRVMHASEDERGNIIVENSNYKYNKEKMLELNKAIRKVTDILNNTTFEIEPFIYEEPTELTEEQREIFAGLVIPL